MRTRRGWALAVAVMASVWSPMWSPVGGSVAAQDAGALDAAVAALMEQHVVPGMALAIVRDGEVETTRAYGVASVPDGIGFDAGATNVRTASVAKLFVATIVTQLVAEGTLELDRDVREYVPEIPIDDRFPDPITLHHLLTHTAGLDDRLIGYAARTREAMRPLGDYLADNFPRRGWPPGSVVGYSNHGVALAAYIVERVTGTDFGTYARETLFGPLGMEATAYRDPPLGEGAGLARGHTCGSEIESCVLEPVPHSHAYPVGLAYTTAADMARFALAHLDGGVVDGRQVLGREGIELMQAEQFTHAPGLPGMSYGFFNQRHGQHRALTHAGSAGGFDALFLLLPERRSGFFFVINGGRSDFGPELRDVLLERLVGEGGGGVASGESPRGSAGLVEVGDLARFAGPYQLTRSAHHTVESLLFLFGMSVRVGVTPEGTLWLPYSGGVEYEPVDSLRFRAVGGQEEIVFAQDERGRITHLFAGVPAFGSVMPGALERRRWYDDAGFMNEFLSYLVGLPLILLLLAWPVAAVTARIVRGRRGLGPAEAKPGSRFALVAALLFSVILTVFVFLGIARSLRMLADSTGIVYGMTPDMRALFLLPWVLAVLGPVVAYQAVVAWRRGYWGPLRRVYYSGVGIAVALALWHLVRWNYLPPVW